MPGRWVIFIPTSPMQSRLSSGGRYGGRCVTSTNKSAKVNMVNCASFNNDSWLSAADLNGSSKIPLRFNYEPSIMITYD